MGQGQAAPLGARRRKGDLEGEGRLVLAAGQQWHRDEHALVAQAVHDADEAVVWDALFDYAPGATTPRACGRTILRELPRLSE